MNRVITLILVYYANFRAQRIRIIFFLNIIKNFLLLKSNRNTIQYKINFKKNFLIFTKEYNKLICIFLFKNLYIQNKAFFLQKKKKIYFKI